MITKYIDGDIMKRKDVVIYIKNIIVESLKNNLDLTSLPKDKITNIADLILYDLEHTIRMLPPTICVPLSISEMRVRDDKLSREYNSKAVNKWEESL